MNNLKNNPIGLDAVIHNAQKALYKLKETWCVDLEGYPRCYILDKGDDQTIEHYLGEKEYSKPLSFAEGNKFFFLAPNDIHFVSGNKYKTNIEVYFVLNVAECKPYIEHRADEEVRIDVLNILNRINGVNVVRCLWQIDTVFNRFRNKNSKSFAYDITIDTQPHHAFKVELELLPYNINQKSCN